MKSLQFTYNRISDTHTSTLTISLLRTYYYIIPTKKIFLFLNINLEKRKQNHHGAKISKTYNMVIDNLCVR